MVQLQQCRGSIPIKSQKEAAMLIKRFAQVAHDKRATGAFRSFHERIALSLFHSQKMSESLEKPMSEFPTLYVIG